MSAHAYSEINFHINWHVKDNNPVLRDEVEIQLQRFIRGKVLETSGMRFHEVGGTNDHVHLVVSAPPTLTPSEWIGQIKGATSHFINHQIANQKTLEWKTGYGIVSFGTRDLPWVLEYVRTQRRHHARGTSQERLERIDTEDNS
ncbi:MAG: IS200/IS605 family transposase [Planctomycetota bacterium]